MQIIDFLRLKHSYEKRLLECFILLLGKAITFSLHFSPKSIIFFLPPSRPLLYYLLSYCQLNLGDVDGAERSVELLKEEAAFSRNEMVPNYVQQAREKVDIAKRAR